MDVKYQTNTSEGAGCISDSTIILGDQTFEIKKKDDHKFILKKNNNYYFGRLFGHLLKIYDMQESVFPLNDFSGVADKELEKMVVNQCVVITSPQGNKFDVFKKVNSLYWPSTPIRYNYQPAKNSVISCSNSHIACIQMAKDNDWPFVIIFEDDCLGRTDSFMKTVEIIRHCPPDCDVLQLGIRGMRHVSYYTDTLSGFCKNKLGGNTWGSHAYIVFSRGYTRTIKNLQKFVVADEAIFDIPSTRLNTYVVKNNQFIQFSVPKENYIHGNKRPNQISYIYPIGMSSGKFNSRPPDGFPMIHL